MSPVPSRWMMPAMPHITAPPFCYGTACYGSTSLLRQDVEVLGDVPVRDRGAVALPLIGLVVVEHPVHVAGQRFPDYRVGLQCLERRAERHRNPLDLFAAGDGVVDVALLGSPWIQVASDPVF